MIFLTSKSGKSNRINVKNLKYCLLTTDDSTGTTYGEVKGFGKAMQIQLTPSVSKGELYGEGVKEEDVSILNGIAVVVDVNKVFAEVRAEICGNTFEDGVVVEAAGDEPPYIALGYEVEQTGGKSEFVWLLKGQAQPINSTNKQSEGNITFSTDSVTINFIPRESDKWLRFFGDAANPDFTDAQAAKWFTTGPSTYPAKGA